MECPNCGGHIGRFELSPNCKYCGVNIFYYQQEKQLSDDAKRTELEFASFRILVSKLKTAFIKGALPITRIVTTVLCICALLIPFASLSVSLPSVSKTVSMGGYGLYDAFSNGSLQAMLDLYKFDAYSGVCLKAGLLAVSMVLILLVDCVILVCEILGFINIQKFSRILMVTSFVGCGASVLAIIFTFVVKSAAQQGGLIDISFGFGAFVCLLMFIVNAVVNMLIIKKNIQPEIKEVDLKRVELRKKIKAGEVTYEELSLPVFESEEEKQKRLEKEKKSEELIKGAKGGEQNG